MLQAINANKAGRNITSEEIHWRQVFKASEDSLTSTIIGLLFYLPHELTWHILLNACYGKEIPTPNTVLSKEFWPLWSGEGTSNAMSVEPDVFIQTPDFDLIIEAKRTDYNQQSRDQWTNELKAYLNEYRDSKKRVYLLALGGISTEATQQLEIDSIIMPVVMCRWERLLRSVRNALETVRHSQSLLSSSSSVVQILEDILLGFSIHGYMTADWFCDTTFEGLQLSPNALGDWINVMPEAAPITFFENLAQYRINPDTLTSFNQLWNLNS